MRDAVPAQRLLSPKSELVSSVDLSEDFMFRPIVDANRRYAKPPCNLLKT